MAAYIIKHIVTKNPTEKRIKEKTNHENEYTKKKYLLKMRNFTQNKTMLET